MIKFWATVITAAVSASAASAADIKSAVTRDGRVVISIIGEISPGDTVTLQAVIKSANDAGKMAASIRLNSIGGNLVEGVKLADAVKFAKMATNVGSNATCASACFLIFAAGETKFANYSARIGVHGASDQGEETIRSGAATVSMARVAKELGVPASIIGRMVVTPPSDMVWLSPSDLQSMGTTMVGKPAQTLPPSANGPIDLRPQTSSDAISASAPAKLSWEELVSAGLRLSSEQNNGKPISVRTCQPEFKICVNAVFYQNNKGIESMLKIARDINDKVISREACTFNGPGDIRKCLDWDRGNSWTSMKDRNGAWQKVSDD
ncbi:ATP-dependent Clp protease proteolytic subunit [Tardiphaga sp. 604_B6_N1_1]|uniref:ATP-dependent Clp protease proteolytic subunit n=1 Tax=unclassified Tardiphaga TaxID=2631404 RepID=UPI003F21EDF5